MIFDKKISFSVVLVMTLLLLAGCSGFLLGQDQGGSSDKGQQDEKSNRSVTVGLSQIGSESDWRMASTRSVQEAFSPGRGYYLIFDDAQQKQENQIKAIREFIDQGVDYIILDPMVETGWDSVLSEAKEAGIPVIVYDRRVDVKDESLYTCWIGSDFLLEGRRACGWLSDYLKDRGINQDINIVNIQGTLGASAQIGRSEALDEAVLAHSKWKLLAKESGDYTSAKGKEVMNDMLRRYGGIINVVYAENDNMAYGVIDAIEAAGYTIGADITKGEILVLSFDASKAGMELALDGMIAVDTECNPLYGPKLVEIIEKLEAGEKVEKETFIEEDQFSAVGYINSVKVEDTSYPVTYLTPEIMKEREY